MNNSKVLKVMITGSSRGIGKNLSRRFIEDGHQVFGCSRGDAKVDHPSYQHYKTDICDSNQVKSMFRDMKKSAGSIDVLINNAAISSMNHFMLSPDATNKAIFDLNVLATLNCSREAIKLLKKGNNTSIINFSSIAVPWNLDGQLIYAASKSAIESSTKIMSKELADLGIRVNCIGLPPVRTALSRSVPKEKIDVLLNRQAIKRQCEFDDIYNVVSFFSSTYSSFITGEVIFLGGIA